MYLISFKPTWERFSRCIITTHVEFNGAAGLLKVVIVIVIVVLVVVLLTFFRFG